MDDGGRAFSAGNTVDDKCAGMSLRDWFAGQALLGIITNVTSAEVSQMRYGTKGGANEALAAYAWADAMLKARKP